jgi:hypothetical protein
MRKKANNALKKFLAIIIGSMLFVTGGFGIILMMVHQEMKQYVAEKYSFLDLKIEVPKYNFLDGDYWAIAKSKTSMDTKFSIAYRDGKVQYDDYEHFVLGKMNTIDRLSAEYTTLAKEIVANELGYKDNHTLVLYDKEAYEKENGSIDDLIKLDMKFDRKLPIHADVILNVNLNNQSLAGAAKVLTDAHQAFKKNGCHFSRYTLSSELIMINFVTPADIESGNLLSLLEQAAKKEDNQVIEKRIPKEFKENISVLIMKPLAD